MKRTLTDITDIDDKMKRLAKQRETLMQQYEELKDTKLIRDANACSVEQDWQNGTYNEHLMNGFFSRLIN